jgi:hypothetical protein
MAVRKASAFAAAFLGAMMLGAWVGPHLTDRPQAFGEAAVRPPPAEPVMTTSQPPPLKSSASEPSPVGTAGTTSANSTARPSISLSEPRFHKRMKPLLSNGADMKVVTAGFRSAEDFAATVHASRNTRVPFMVLKHQVVEQGKSLASAIHTVKPTADASLEADLARSEARSDLASLK